MDNPFEDMELASVNVMNRWERLCAWVYHKMTGRKIGLLYKIEK